MTDDERDEEIRILMAQAERRMTQLDRERERVDKLLKLAYLLTVGGGIAAIVTKLVGAW